MQVWTTPQLKDLLPGGPLSINVHPVQHVRNAYLDHAGPGDIGLFPFRPDDRTFLESVRSRQMCVGPILLLSASPVQNREAVVSGHKAIILETDALGQERTREIISLVLDIALERLPLEVFVPPSTVMHAGDGAQAKSANNGGVLPGGYLDHNVPAIISLQIMEQGKPVTARATCSLQGLADGTFKISQLRPASHLRNMQQGANLTLLVAHPTGQHQATVTVERIETNHLIARTVTAFTQMTRRFHRIQPSPERPVAVSVIVPGHPTLSMNAEEISRAGVSFSGIGVLMPAEVYAFFVRPPDASGIGCYGTIRSKVELPDRFRYGVELHVHPKDEEIMARYIISREREIAGLFRGGR